MIMLTFLVQNFLSSCVTYSGAKVKFLISGKISEIEKYLAALNDQHEAECEYWLTQKFIEKVCSKRVIIYGAYMN